VNLFSFDVLMTILVFFTLFFISDDDIHKDGKAYTWRMLFYVI